MKKGISALIGWVLLVGFSIAMAAFVTNWVIGQTEKFNPEKVAGGSEIYCNEVFLSIQDVNMEDNQKGEVACKEYENANAKILNLVLKNKGKFTITKVDVSGQKSKIFNFPEDGLKPGKETGNLGNNPVKIYFCKQEEGNEILIVPSIEVEEEKYVCEDSAAIINDEVLANAKGEAYS